MNSEMEPSSKKEKINLIPWVVTFAVFMLMMQVGLALGWISPNIAYLLSEESPISMTPSDISWLMSITTLGNPVGSIVGSVLVEYFGSRKTVFVSYLLIAVSWTCLLFVNSVSWLYASRFICSIASTMAICCYAMYMAEVTNQAIRGTLIALSTTGMTLGVLLGVTAETYLPKNLTSSMYLAGALIGAVIMCWLKDTPYILMKCDDMEGAEESIAFYHSNTNVKKELDLVKNFVEKSEGFRDKLRKLRQPSVIKSLSIVCLLSSMGHLSGAGILMSYMEVILSSAKIDFIEPAQCVIYTNIISIIAAFSTVKLSDILGRRLSLTISSFGTSLALICLGIHFYLLSSEFNAHTLQWLPVLSLIIFFVTVPVGYGSVPGTLLSEMFPENMKSLATCVASLSASFFCFVVTKAYQPIVDAYGEAYAFWIFALMSALAMPCALFLLIETRGKSFQQIQDQLNKK